MDWYWFLLPVAAASGWYAATNQKSNKTNHTIAPEYIKGLNYLLERKTDKAVELFIKFFQVNPTTMETHILLGNLFRRKGELEKAIRIHHNLVQREYLSDQYKNEALLELSQDYFHAGLLDSAEEICKRLIKSNTSALAKQGYEQLITIYEIEKSWEQAIKCAGQLRKSDDRYNAQIAHYYCEIAEKALSEEDYSKVKSCLKKAQSLNASFARNTIIQGDLEFKQGRRPAALRHYANTFSDYSQYAYILLPKIKACFTPYDPSEFADYINSLEPQQMTTSYVTSYVEALFEAERIQEAEKFLFNLVDTKHAPLQVLKIFIEDKLKDTSLEKDTVMEKIMEGISQSVYSDYFYACRKCGLETYQLYWQCPSCHSWDSVDSLDIIKAPESPKKQKDKTNFSYL